MKKRFTDLSPKKVPVQARSKATYTAIVQAAARVLERKGYEAITTNHIADEAGIGIASLYEYFPNKQAVVAAVITQVVDNVIDEIDGALSKATGKTTQEALSMWLAAMFDAVAKRRKLVAVLLREVPFRSEVPALRDSRDALLALARRAHALSPTIRKLEHLEALTYLLPLMVSHAVVESVVSPPKHLTRAQVQDGLVDLVFRVVLEPQR